MTNKEIAKKFKLLGQLMELHGENPFKIRATDSAARFLNKLASPLAQLSDEERASLPGIGKGSLEKIKELLETKSLKELEHYLSITPAGVLTIMNIRGVGPKKAALFWQELGIDNLGALWYACKDDKVSQLKGFGQKTQKETQRLVEFTMENEGKFRFADALTPAKKIIKKLQKLEIPESQISLTGAFRRKVEVLDSIDILLCKSKKDILAFVKQDESFTTIAENDDYVSALFNGIYAVQLYFCTVDTFYSRLVETTGNKEHIAGLKTLLDNNIPNLSSEEAIYDKADLAYIPPVRREGLNEIELAKDKKLEPLIKKSDLKGSIHNHSTYSDGINTVKEMAIYCRDVLNLEYLGISDHSKTAVYANGLKVEDVNKQWEEIDALNKELAPFHIFKGIESDILANGSLDYSDDVLAGFDFVVASIHSQLKMEEKKATSRLIKAIENPYTTILGHPTARQLLIRSGYEIDHKKVIDACAANQVIIEINANPLRLDIDWRWIPYCIEKGVMLSINPDAHATQDLHYTDFGIIMAQKGGLTKENCLNCLSLDEIKQYFKKKK